MEISELTLKLIMLLIPGATASLIFEKLTVHIKWSPFQFVTNSILFAGLSYLVAQGLSSIGSSHSGLEAFWDNLPTKDIPYLVIVKGLAVAPFIAVAFTYFDFFKLLNKAGKKIKATNKYGDENLFTHFLNSNDVIEVYVRDFEDNMVYHGLVDSYSETNEFKEISLYDVNVYDNSTGDHCYKVKNLYLAKPKDRLIIEVPYIEDNNDVEQTTTA